MRLHIILRELQRSFVKNIYVNILLMIEFAICFFLLITLLTFYVDIGDNTNYGMIRDIDNREWYNVRVDNGDSLNAEMARVSAETDGLIRLKEFYNKLSDNEYFDFVTLKDGIQNIYFASDDMDGIMGKGQYDKFIPHDADISIDQCYNQVKRKDGTTETIVRIKSSQMNYNAYELFGMKLAEGEGWTKDNMTVKSEDYTMPIILGYEYKGYFNIGDTIELSLPVSGLTEYDDTCYNAQVVGILEEDTWIPSHDAYNDLVCMDEQIIVPVGMNIEYIPQTKEECIKFASGQYSESICYSMIALKEGVTYQQAMLKSNEWSENYDVYNLLFTSTSFGMDYLKNETETTVIILSVLTVVMVFFALFCLITSAISRIKKNLRVYAIYMVNGSGILNILIPYLIETFVLFIPAMAINAVLLQEKMYLTRNYAPLILLISMVMIVYIGLSIFIAIKLKGIDTEKLMRRRD